MSTDHAGNHSGDSAGQPVARPPRRFRTRLLLVLVGAGALAVLAVGLAGFVVIDKLLAISLEPVATVLDDVDRHLEANGDGILGEDVQEAQLYLVQAELARSSLAGLAPWVFIGVLAVILAALAIVALRLSRSLSTPIERLTNGMLRFARGDLEHRVPESAGRRGDELDFLIDRFNRMGAELLAQRERLRVSEELAAWQDVARALAHELKNPLTAMKLAVARTARAIDRVDFEPAVERAFRESMQLFDQEMDVLIRMTKSFSEFAKLPSPSLESVELGAVLEEAVALYREASPVALEVEIGQPAYLRGDAGQLRRALGNLIKNAMEASKPGDGPIRVDIELTGKRARVVIADSGRGIKEPLSGKALTRSLGSTKPEGSGLGLPIAYKIIHDHLGSLALEPGPAGGCRAVVFLPILDAEEDPSS